MVISIVGNVKQDFIETIEHYLSMDIKVNSQTITQPRPAFHANHINQTKETEQAHICLGYEGGVGMEDKLIYPMMIVNNVLGGSMSSRLFQEIREKDGMAYSIFSYHSSFLDSGLLTIYAGTSNIS